MNLVMEGQLAHEEELGMAKHGKLLPGQLQRDRPQNGDSILLRSAESIGRVIGTLQRQLDGARDRLSGIGGSREATMRASQNGGRTAKQKPKATTRVRRTANTKSVAAAATKAAEAKVPIRKSTKRTQKAAAAKSVKTARARKSR